MKTWSCTDIIDEIQRLRSHDGFPSGENINCPVFLQDKFVYIKALEKFGLCIPSYQAFLPDYPAESTESYAYRVKKTDTKRTPLCNHQRNVDNKALKPLDVFLDDVNEGNGWVVKYPFVTNSEGIKFCHNKSSVIQMILRERLKYSHIWGRIPYAIIQPKLFNRKEYKVVLLGGKGILVISNIDFLFLLIHNNDLLKLNVFTVIRPSHLLSPLVTLKLFLLLRRQLFD